MKKESNFTNLYKKIDATSKTRFHASRRLRLHATCATFTVVFISMVLIFISLMQAYELGINIKSKYVSLIQVFSSITVLVYSLLIDKNDYSSYSEKMYSCASRLGELKQKLYPHIDSESIEKYDEINNEYQSILKLYETESINDFRADYTRAKLEMPENYRFSTKEKIKEKLYIYFMYSINFSQYAIIFMIFIWLLIWLCFGLDLNSLANE